jgi:hypothetical protein
MALRFLNSGYFAGSVGIGTVSPSGKFEIASDSSLSSYITQYTDDADGAELVIRTARGTQAVPVQYSTGDSAGRLLFQAYTSSGSFKDAASIESVMESGSANAYGGLRFNYMPTSSPYVLTEGMRLKANGNVGIGTNNPLTPLHVLDDSSANARAKIRIQGGATSGYGDLAVQSGYIRLIINDTDSTAYSASNQFNYINGSVATTLNSNGLGVGTTLPAFKLDVGGTFGVSNLPFNTDSVSVLVADETIGVEEVTNGSFTTDADWTKGTGWAIGGGTANGTSSVNPLYQTISGFTAGNVYKVRFEVTAVTSGYIRVYAYVGTNGTFTNIFNSTSLTTGVYESTFEFGGTNKILRFYGSVASTGGFTGSIDNVSVKQVTSASNQIQKRELGTGAFGPTPVGAFLPLAGGTMTGNTDHNDNVYSKYGTADQLRIWNNGSNSYIFNYASGNINIGNDAADKDVIFYADRGDGLEDIFFRLDGSETNGTTVLGVTLFPDKSQARFGDQGDLRIYHDGSNSYIQDTGTGTLNLQGSTQVIIGGTNGEVGVQYVENGGVGLRHNNVTKLTTESTGINVIGEGIFTGNVGIGTTSPGAFLQVGGTTNSNGSPGSFNIAGSYGVDSWARAYIASNTNILSILQADNTALPNGGAYRVTGHIDGTGTDQSSRAVFWNQNGTWQCNLTSASGTTSNSILFLIDATTGLPSVKTYHANDYTVRVWHERINLNEGVGTDNTRHYFGTDSYMTQITQDVSMFTTYSGNNLNGKLGVGIAVPGARLDVANGNAAGNAALDFPVIRLTNTTASSDWDVGDKVGVIEYYTTDASGNAPYVTSFINSVNETVNGTLPSGALVFGTANENAVSGANEKIRLSEEGSLIFRNFTTSLATPTTGYLKEMFIANVDGVGTFASNGASNGAYGSFKFITRKGDSSDPIVTMTLDSSHQVGIGIQSPNAKLQVAGGIQMADDTDNAGAAKAGTMRYRTGTEYVEVTGTELISSIMVNTSYSTFDGASSSGFHAINSASTTQRAGTADEISFVTNKTYRVNIDVAVASGSAPFFRAREGIATSPVVHFVQLVNGSNIFTFTSTITITGLLEFSNTSNAEYTLSNVSLMEVTEEDASYADMCMQTGASTYEWVNIVRNTY